MRLSMRLSNAKFKNCVFHLALSPPFTIFATNTATTADDGQTVADKLPEAPQPFTTENL